MQHYHSSSIFSAAHVLIPDDEEDREWEGIFREIDLARRRRDGDEVRVATPVSQTAAALPPPRTQVVATIPASLGVDDPSPVLLEVTTPVPEVKKTEEVAPAVPKVRVNQAKVRKAPPLPEANILAAPVPGANNILAAPVPGAKVSQAKARTWAKKARAIAKARAEAKNGPSASRSVRRLPTVPSSTNNPAGVSSSSSLRPVRGCRVCRTDFHLYLAEEGTPGKVTDVCYDCRITARPARGLLCPTTSIIQL